MEAFFSPLLLRAFPKLQLNEPNQLGHTERSSHSYGILVPS